MVKGPAKTASGKKGLVGAAEATKLLQAKLAVEKGMGTRFKPETYMVVTRWTADTRVKYIPNPKTPGTKSYPRYERYSKAKTVGEAIELGAYPADLLWDLERGFYKVTGGPIRDEPIDLHRAKAEGLELTKTDEMLGRWVMRELCRELGKDQSTIVKEAGVGESGVVHALRALADKEAAFSLKRVESERRKVSDEELLRALRRWCYGQNPNRINVMPDGQTWVNSDTVGLLCARDGGVNATRTTKMYPNMMRLMCRYIRDRQPAELGKIQFPFTSINMNFGYGAKRHRDGNNTGLSILAGFGDYEGGELHYWPEDDRSAKVEALPMKGRETLDIRKNVLLFDGHRAHEVAPFKGERYSLVWFTCARFWKAGDDLQKIKELGFELPTEATVKAVARTLREPAGYKAGAAAKAAAAKGPGAKGYMTWPKAGVDNTPPTPTATRKRAAPEVSPAEKEKKAAPAKRARTDACKAAGA